MKKILTLLIPLLIFTSCSSKEEVLSSSLSEESQKEINMKLYIDEIELEVSWEDNDSIRELKEILPITINMHEYGGFEQTGMVGQNIVRNDKQIDVIPGDIVLYNGNQISVFYSTSSWSYTRLGHITNKSNSELNALLNKESVTFVLKGE
jgi:hypothetical protein